MRFVKENYQLIDFEPYRPIRAIVLDLPSELQTLGGIPFPVESSHIQVSLLVDGSPLVCGVRCEQDDLD